MGTVDPHKVYKSQVICLFDLDGGIQGISKECLSVLRIDLSVIEKKKFKCADLFPDVWAFLHPFEERGSFKKEFRMKYKLPTDNEYAYQIIPDKVTEIDLVIKVAPVYTRRFAKTLGYILIIEEDIEQIVISKDMSKPKLSFQWRFDVNIDVDESSGKERALILGEPTKEGADMMTMQESNILEQSMFTSR